MGFGSTGFSLCGFDFWTVTGSSARPNSTAYRLKPVLLNPRRSRAAPPGYKRPSHKRGPKRDHSVSVYAEVRVWLRNQIDGFRDEHSHRGNQEVGQHVESQNVLHCEPCNGK